jgi:hypothetical protein
MPCFVRNGDILHNSPDLNVLDYSIWSYLKERLNKHGLISSVDRLKMIFQEEWEVIPQQLIKVSIDSWLSRLHKVEKTRGVHIVFFSFLGESRILYKNIFFFLLGYENLLMKKAVELCDKVSPAPSKRRQT